MLCLRYLCGVPEKDIANTYGTVPDHTLIHRILLPNGTADARYLKVRELFFRLYDKRQTITKL